MELKCKSRKLFSANYSFFISLPIDWIKTQNLAIGDKISVKIQEDGSLRIEPERTQENEIDTT